MRIFSFCLLLLFSLSCQPYVPRGTMLPLRCTDLSEQMAHAEESDSFCQKDWPSENWWQIFGDSSLDNLIVSALRCHPDMKIAEARIRLAYAIALQSKSRLLPHLFLMGNVTRERGSLLSADVPVPDLYTQTTLAFNAFYEVDLWHKNRALYLADLDATFAAIADRAEAKLLLSISVAQNYFHLQMHQKQYDLIQEEIRIKRSLQELLTERNKSGIISDDQLYQIDQKVAELEDKKEMYEGLLAIDKERLNALSGNSCCQPIVFENLLLQAGIEDRFALPSSLPFDLLARRPDLIAKKWLIAQGRFLVHAARARFYPSLDLLSYLGVQSIRLHELFSERALLAIGEATGVLPIFTGGKLQAELAEEEEKYEMAIQEYNQTLLLAVEQVSHGITQLITQDKRRQQVQRMLQDSQNIYELALQKFQNGTTNRLSLLSAEEDLLIHKELLIIVDLQRYEAALLLIQAIGGGYDCRRSRP